MMPQSDSSQPGFVARLAAHLLLAGVFTLLLIAPDHVYAWLNPGYQIGFNPKIAVALYVVGLLVLALRGRWAVRIAVGFFALLQVSQFLHFAYFGTLITPHAVILLFTEFEEILDSVSGTLGFLVWPMAIVALTYALLLLLLRRTQAWRIHIPLSALLLLALVSFLPYKAYTAVGSQQFYPNPRAYSIKNTLYAFSFFVGRELPDRLLRGKKERVFEPYEVTAIDGQDRAFNVVIVMGESLGYGHMGLYGYHRDTTPLLSQFADDPGFVVRPAISGGVSTKVALPTFFNLVREPGNTRQMNGFESNLFRMAKQRGMATAYLSVQTANLATNMGDSYIDRFVTREDIEAVYLEKRDEALLDLLADVDLERPNFVVLHQRSSHSPYDKYYPARFGRYPLEVEEFKDYMTNAYDNSILFTDFIVHGIIRDLEARSTLPTYLVFTADHGERIGEKGRYGHSDLDRDVVRVPFIFHAVHGADEWSEKAAALDEPSHYEVGKLVAELLGFRVKNPNEDSTIVYVNGSDIGGNAGYLTIERLPGAEQVSLGLH